MWFCKQCNVYVDLLLKPPQRRAAKKRDDGENSSHRLSAAPKYINRKMIDANEVTVSLFFRSLPAPQTDRLWPPLPNQRTLTSVFVFAKCNHFSFGNKIILIVIEF